MGFVFFWIGPIQTDGIIGHGPGSPPILCHLLLASFKCLEGLPLQRSTGPPPPPPPPQKKQQLPRKKHGRRPLPIVPRREVHQGAPITSDRSFDLARGQAMESEHRVFGRR